MKIVKPILMNCFSIAHGLNLDAWQDTSFFTEEERAILALTEEVTLISQHVSDETYEIAVKLRSA
jgi:alkylhydroperoxidase family enzyme